MMWLETGARLHFGLLRLPRPGDGDSPWLRAFGGVGAIIDSPGFRLRAERASQWEAHGADAERIVPLMMRYVADLDDNISPIRIIAEQTIPPHSGLGSGTQLALAVGRLLEAVLGHPRRPIEQLAQLMDRGKRSAVGLHGFDSGGLLVDAGKRLHEAVAPLVGRYDLPESWQVVVLMPPAGVGLCGAAERDAFARLASINEGDRAEWGSMQAANQGSCDVVLQGLLPALAAGSFEDFSECLHELNRRSGEAFASVQGGCYGSPWISEAVKLLRQWRIRGCGQSSWGPAVFALTQDADEAQSLCLRIEKQGLEIGAKWRARIRREGCSPSLPVAGAANLT